ncbi:MAG: Fe(3+) ABC transporter substrate-binding protein [Betaproteobacteria bacterium]|nr:Fe(3+) ABC transporter substrate-binding protein [Betaproteobacteria bacterium]
MYRLSPSTYTAILALSIFTGGAHAAGVLNLYSSRHYQTDEALYKTFESQTGIKINRIEAAEDPLIERMKGEGDKSPADVLITVDMGRLLKAQQLGLFQPIQSELLKARIPRELRAADGTWFGFSLRARPIYYAKARIDPKTIPDYESLVQPSLKGKICVRSGSHPYNISLMSSIIAANGPDRAEQWARGMVANFARAPKGGDTDQIRAVAAGECDIALGNTYYFARLLRSGTPEDKAVADRVGVVFPNQSGAHGRGTHVNVSGAGVARHAPNRANAIKFLEYLAGESAQRFFSDGNNEYPVAGKSGNPALRQMGDFKRDTLPMDMVGKNYAAASQLFDRAGWK